MIWKIFLAALLFTIAEIPIICGIGSYLIQKWWEVKAKFIGTMTKAAGEEIGKMGDMLKAEIRKGEKQSDD